jgi:hypothetical protein
VQNVAIYLNKSISQPQANKMPFFFLYLMEGKLMKHTIYPLLSLACLALLASCGPSVSSSSNGTASSAATSQTSNSVSASASSSNPAEIYGDFSINQTSNGTAPVYDSSTSTWTIGVSSSKAVYAVKGYLKGRIVVANPDNLTSFKGVVLTLNGAYIEGNSETEAAVDFTLSGKYLALESAEGTNNVITNSALAVNSENNLRFGGAGDLTLISTTGHGAKADDILFYGSTNVSIAASADGLHGHNFYTNDSESTPTEYTGTLTIKGVQEQALDFCDGSGTSEDPWSGEIIVDAGAKIVIDTAQNVARVNIAFTVKGSIVATNILDSAPIITKNSPSLVVTIADGAVFTVNGTAITSQTL